MDDGHVSGTLTDNNILHKQTDAVVALHLLLSFLLTVAAAA